MPKIEVDEEELLQLRGLQGVIRKISSDPQRAMKLEALHKESVTAIGQPRATVTVTVAQVGGAQRSTLPLQALSLRDGFSYVFTVGPNSRVTQVKVQLGRRTADRVEVIGPLKGDERVVAAGAAFLTDGDLVRVVAQ